MWDASSHDFLDKAVVSPDGRLIATQGRADGLLKLWDASGRELWSFAVSQEMVTSLAFSPDGHWLASGSLDSTARLWDMQSPDYASHVLKGHTRNVNTLAFSPDGSRLCAGDREGRLVMFTLQHDQQSVA